MDAVLKRGVVDANDIFHVAVRAVQADRLIAEVPWQEFLKRPLDRYGRIRVAGVGKAALAMTGVVEHILGVHLTEAVTVVPRGYQETLPSFLPAPVKAEVIEGGHPVPNAASIRAARSVLDLAMKTGPDDLLIVLISGGGSALCADFVSGVSLKDAQSTFRLLLKSGADIHAMNTVRKHISRISGGRLAEAAASGEVLALVVSDVVGDDLSVIASGPTVPDPTTFRDATEVLHSFGLWDQVSHSIRHYLEEGGKSHVPETPKPGSKLFDRVRTELIGSNISALEAAAEVARRCRYSTYILDQGLTGEAREVGAHLAREAVSVSAQQPVCLLWGGETTVTVRGKGKGGRNQELALAAALELDGVRRPVVFASGGTDGRDGPTDAAGAWVTHQTARIARDERLSPEAFLANNDAYSFFERTGNLLRTGPTHTNVMDVQIALVLPEN